MADDDPMNLQQRALRGSLAGGTSLVVNLGLTLVQVPLLLHFWGRTGFGLWLTLNSLLSLLSVFDVGHQDYVGRLLNRHYVENPGRLKICLASAVCIGVGLAAGEMIVGSVAIFLIPVTTFLGDSAAGVAGEVRGAALVYLVYWTLFGSVGGVFVRLYNLKGLFARGTGFAIAMKLSQFAALIGSAMQSSSLFYAMVSYCVAGGVVNIALIVDVRRKFGDLLPGWDDVSMATGLKNFGLSLWLTANNFLDQASSNGLTVLIAHRLGAEAVPVLATLRTVANVVTQGASVVVMPLVPDFTRYYFLREPSKLTAVLATTWAVGGIFVNAAILVLILLAPSLYAWWTHGRIAFDPVLFQYVCLTVCIRSSMSGSALFLFSINQLKAQLAISVGRGITVVLVFLATVGQLGSSAAGLALLVSEVVACLGITTWYVRSEIQKLSGQLPWHSLALTISSFVVVAGVFWGSKPVPVTVVAGFCLLLVLAWAHWRHLPATVHQRLLSLAGGLVHRYL